MESDVIVVGGGPAGSTCAAFCAAAGLRVTILERAIFPREKVCGDCLNPGCWPVFARLDLRGRVLQLPHSQLQEVVFVDARGRSQAIPLPAHENGEIAVKRSALDALLLQRAQELGATVCSGAAVTSVSRPQTGTESRNRVAASPAHWRVITGEQEYVAPLLVAADGRNSTVARALDLLPPAGRDRVGLQTHLPLPAKTAGRVVMRFLPGGYCGLADVGGGQANLCLVSAPAEIESVKAWAEAEFHLTPQHPWRSIAPLERKPVPPQHPGLLLVGDAACVVEPFTGEGIFYALRSGELAAEAITAADLARYPAAHRALYRGRLWVNLLARVACTRPAFASTLLGVTRLCPSLLSMLTSKVTAASLRG